MIFNNPETVEFIRGKIFIIGEFKDHYCLSSITLCQYIFTLLHDIAPCTFYSFKVDYGSKVSKVIVRGFYATRDKEYRNEIKKVFCDNMRKSSLIGREERGNLYPYPYP